MLMKPMGSAISSTAEQSSEHSPSPQNLNSTTPTLSPSIQQSPSQSAQAHAKTIQQSSTPIYKRQSSTSDSASSIPVIKDSFNIRSQRPFPLNAAQESEVRDLYYKRVRDACASEIREFAHCCAGRTFSISWACRQQRKGMNECMIARATREEEDKAREEWFQKIPDRKRERDELEAWKDDQRRLKKEWWKDYREGKDGEKRPPEE